MIRFPRQPRKMLLDPASETQLTAVSLVRKQKVQHRVGSIRVKYRAGTSVSCPRYPVAHRVIAIILRNLNQRRSNQPRQRDAPFQPHSISETPSSPRVIESAACRQRLDNRARVCSAAPPHRLMRSSCKTISMLGISSMPGISRRLRGEFAMHPTKSDRAAPAPDVMWLIDESSPPGSPLKITAPHLPCGIPFPTAGRQPDQLANQPLAGAQIVRGIRIRKPHKNRPRQPNTDSARCVYRPSQKRSSATRLVKSPPSRLSSSGCDAGVSKLTSLTGPSRESRYPCSPLRFAAIRSAHRRFAHSRQPARHHGIGIVRRRKNARITTAATGLCLQ